MVDWVYPANSILTPVSFILNLNGLAFSYSWVIRKFGPRLGITFRALRPQSAEKATPHFRNGPRVVVKGLFGITGTY